MSRIEPLNQKGRGHFSPRPRSAIGILDGRGGTRPYTQVCRDERGAIPGRSPAPTIIDNTHFVPLQRLQRESVFQHLHNLPMRA